MRKYLSIFLLLAATGVHAAEPSRAEVFASLPNWSGIWLRDGAGGEIDVSGYPTRSGLAEWQMMGFGAPYTPEVRARFERELPQIMAYSATVTTEAWGYPLMMDTATPLQFLITPEETLILNFYREARHIYTDGRPLPAEADRWPTPWGESIGHWEGDTLVIETVSVQQPGIFNIRLPLLSENARYVERIRMTAPGRLESEFTVEDPATLTRPWVIHLAYKPAEGMDRMFHMPFDNDRTETDANGVFTIAPGE